MSPEMTALLAALREWRQAIAALKHCQDKQHWEQQADAASQRILKHLSDPTVVEAIDGLIAAAIAPEDTTPETIRTRLLQQPTAIAAAEMRSIEALRVSHKELEQVFQAFLRRRAYQRPIPDSQTLAQQFQTLHEQIMADYRATLPLSRKLKKQRRQQLLRNVLFATLGMGLVAGNTQMQSETASVSYIVGGNAFLNAVWHWLEPNLTP